MTIEDEGRDERPGPPGASADPDRYGRYGQYGADRAGPPEGPDARPQPRYGQYAPVGGRPDPTVPPGPAAWQDPAARPGPAAWQDPAARPEPVAWQDPAADLRPPAPARWADAAQRPPAYGQYGPQPGPAGPGIARPYGPAGFAGPVQPGIIPLRPLNLGEILDGGFRAIRANPKVMFGLSLLVLGIASVIEAVVLVVFLGQAVPVLDPALLEGSATASEALGVGPGSVLGLLAAAVAVFLATIILTGLLIISVSQSVLGRVVSIGEVWTRARGRLGALVGLTVLIGVAATIAITLVVVVSALLIGALATALGDSAGVLVILGLLIFAAAVVATAWLSIKLALAAPVLVLERASVMTSLRRSWSLTAGHFWRIFGSLVLSSIIVSVISYALMVVPTLITALVATSPDAIVTATVVTTVLSVLISAATTPFLAAVLALVYIDVRMRKEGLDVELARAAGA